MLLRATVTALLLAFSTGASAQLFTYQGIDVDGESGGDVDTDAVTDGIGSDYCNSSTASLRLTLMTVPGMFFDIWHDNGNGTNCATDDNARVTNDMRSCLNVAQIAVPTNEQTLNIPLSMLIGDDSVATNQTSTLCSPDTDRREFNFLFIATDSSSAVTGELDAGAYQAQAISIDTNAEAPPTELPATASGSSPQISWTVPSSAGGDQQMFLRYQVEISPSTCGGTAASISTTTRTTSRGATGFQVPLTDLGVGDGESVSVRVATIDRAGNVGEYSSETVCVTKEPTFGLCEVRGGCPSACSAGGPMSGSVALPVLMALLLIRRRSR